MPSRANLILQRLAAIELTASASDATIPVVIAADPYQPSNAESVNCPFWINAIRTGTGNQSELPIANGQQYISTMYDLILCLARREANIDLKYGVQNTLLWRDAVYSAFAPHVKLSAPTVLIQSSTNASPIQISTNSPHCLNPAGDQVTITNHLVNTNANGTWNAVIIDSNTFTLTGSTGNGVGGATGTAVMTQNNDMAAFITDARIRNWQLVNMPYGDTEFLALVFGLQVNEMFVQTIAP